MIRNGRTPTVLLVALTLIIIVISYNNWSLSQRNISLRDALIAKDEKLNDIMEKKAYVEKQLDVNADRVKYFEERIEANKQAAKQKDTDIDDLNSKLKTKTSENDKLAIDLNEAKDALNLCKLEKNKEIELVKSQEAARHQEELNKLLDKTNCNSQMDTYKSNLINLVKSQFLENDSIKILSLINTADTNSINIPNKKRDLNLVDKKEEHTTTIDVCSLPKLVGDCNNSTDRYFFDSVSGRCLVFAFSGCNGNQNNFETQELCTSKCSSKPVIETTSIKIVNVTLAAQPEIKQKNTTLGLNEHK